MPQRRRKFEQILLSKPNKLKERFLNLDLKDKNHKFLKNIIMRKQEMISGLLELQKDI